MNALIYTDGSCHTQIKIGAWAAILFVNDKKHVLSGRVENTTHQQMELMAVIEALKFLQKNYLFTQIKIISDSQYVIGLLSRKTKFENNGFKTKANNEIRNAVLVKEFLLLASVLPIQLEKIKAHQKQTEQANYNIEVDKLSRKIVRDFMNNL